MVNVNQIDAKGTHFFTPTKSEITAHDKKETIDLWSWCRGGYDSLFIKAQQIQLLLTDCDGVLTDGSVFYTAQGEEMKRFSIRDGMGVERLRKIANVEVGIITGERNSFPLQRRAEKLGIDILCFDAQNKGAVLHQILERFGLLPFQAAYIGDDANDLSIMQLVGLSACPTDALPMVRDVADYVCQCDGGHGAFREFAELIIAAKLLP